MPPAIANARFDSRSAESSPYLFLSYARSDDEPFVERLHHDLEARGIRVWWDRQSMSNRGLTFLEEIQRAIESVDRVIAVVGPNAVKSDYVLYEWDYTLLFGKGVVPILRLGDYSSIPSNLARDLRKDHSPDFRAARSYDQALDELDRIVREPVVPLGPLRATPALPISFVPRPGAMNAIRQAIYADIERPKPASSAAEQALILRGMGGSGKSVLAAAFSRSIDTRRVANDGIVWLKAGRDTKPADRLANLWLLGSTFGDSEHYTDENQARSRLPQLLSERACLIVLDDVWRKEDAEPYLNALGPRCRLLITTRDASLGVLGRSFALDVLSDAEALMLLARSSGQAVDGLPPAAKEVARECGNLPLALAMIGSMVNGNPARWEYALHRLATLKLDKIRFRLPNYDYPDLLRALEVSVDDLEPEQQERYLDLAVFSPGAAIPEETLRVLWEPTGVDPDDAIDLIDLFVRRSLARWFAKGRIILHDLQTDYVRGRAADLPALHRRLLDAYAKHCDDSWPTGPDDGYFFQFLPYHLLEAGRQTALRDLLLNYRWLDSKLRSTSVIDVIADYDLVGDYAETRLVQQTLQLGAAALASDKSQLRSQLYARLLPFQQAGLLELAADCQRASGPWIRPLVPTLTLPGGPLIRTLAGHEGFVGTIVIFDEGRRAISGSSDNTARVWDVERGTEIMKLPDHSNVVTAVAVTSDGARAVTAPWDYTLKVWDLREGKEIGTFKGPRCKVHTLVVTPDDHCVISGAADNTIKVWDLETGTLVSSLDGHTGDVVALTITPDKQTLLSGSWDGRIGIWDLGDRRLIRFVEAHNKWIIGLSSDNEHVASASTDETVKIWAIATGEQVWELTGFHFYSYATHPIALCPGGSRLVLGGGDGDIGIWDLAKGAAWPLQEGHSAWITAVQAFSDNQQAISASGDKTIKVWNLNAPPQDERPTHGYVATSVMVRPGRQAVSASPRDGLKVWDLSTLEPIQSFPAPLPDKVARMVARAGMSMHPGDFLAVALFPDGRRCVWALQDESVRISDLDAAQELARLNKPGVQALAVTSDGRYVICASSEGDTRKKSTITVWDWTVNRIVSSVTAADDPFALAVSPDGSKLLCSSWFGHTVDVWDLPSCTELRSFNSHTGVVTGFAFSLDGKSVYSASSDKTIRSWDLDTAKEFRTLSSHAAGVNACATYPDSPRLVSCSDDCSLTVWDTATGQSIATFGGDVPFRCCAVSPDDVIIAGDNLGRIHFLRLETGPTGRPAA